MRIVFMGTPAFAVASLEVLHHSEHTIVGVVTSPDRPAGRGKKMQSSAVKTYAEANGLQLLQPEKLRSEKFLSELEALQADLFVVVAFRMLPKVVWEMPSKGTINLHGSLLPDYRGAAPINWAIINGETKTGASTFFIDEKIDTGDLIDQVEITISENMTAGELHDSMMEKGANLALMTVNDIASNQISSIPQRNIEIQNLKKAPKLTKETGQIDWNQTAYSIHNLIRGLSPYPAAWCKIKINDEFFTCKIYTSIVCDDCIAIGKIVTDEKSFLKVGCNDGSISILEIQLQGKSKLSIKDFLNGQKNKAIVFH